MRWKLVHIVKWICDDLWQPKVKVVHCPLSKVTQIQCFPTSFPQKNTRPFEAKFRIEPPWVVGMKIYSNVLGHITKMASGPFMVKISLLGTKWTMTLKHCIQHRVLKSTKFVQMMTLGWPWLFLWHGQICFLMHGWRVIQHIVTFIQACSNSVYPMHSGERYRTISPLG